MVESILIARKKMKKFRRCKKCNARLLITLFPCWKYKKKNGDYSVYHPKICKKCMSEKEKKEYYKFRIIRIKKHQKYHLTPQGVLTTYRTSAKRRKLEFNLDLEFVKLLLNKSCNYCGDIILGRTMGIDRVDNSKGYTKENCVPCCVICNTAKSTLTKDEFINHCKKVTEFYLAYGREYIENKKQS
jgi:hypothetical protein